VLRAPTTEHEARLLAEGPLDVARDPGVLLGRDQRAEIGILATRPDPERGRLRAQTLDELVLDLRRHEESRAGRADLAAVAESAFSGIGSRALEIGVREHQHRVLAAELEHDRHGPLGRERHDPPPGLDAAGEADAAHQRVAHQRLPCLLAEAGDDVEDASGQARLPAELGQAQRGERRLLGGLEDRAAPGRECRRERADGHTEREVPGHEMGGHAKRLEQREVHDLMSERHGRALHLVGGAGVVAKRRDHALDVAARFAQRLADVGGLEERELVLGRLDRIGEPEQQPAPFGRRHLAPGAGHRCVGRLHRSIDIKGVGTSDFLDRLLGRRIDGGEGRA
jgi:hypothetical protein